MTTKHPSSSSNNKLLQHPCSLDIYSPVSRRRAQRSIAQRIARQRIVQPNANEQAEDGSNVVHRTGIQHGDYSSDALSSYVQVEFLNQHDVILAGCQNGCIDVVRLGRYRPSDEQDEHNTSRRRRRPHGTLLASKVNTSISEPIYYLKSLQEGHAFVAGQRGGRFSLFATEHASSYAYDDTTMTPAIQQRLSTTSGDGMVLRSRTFETHCHGGYGDDYAQYIHSVENMLMSFGLRVKGMHFQEIQHFPGRPSSIILNPRCEYAWDFRETPSTLLASFLERETNSFSVTVMDSRVSHSTRQSVAGVSQDAPNNTKYNASVGLVASACFVSDHCLATLHMWQNPCRESSTTSVKLWDIRSTTQKLNAKPMAESILSPSIYDATGNATTESTFNLDKHVKWASSPAQAKLTPSIDDNGMLMANIVTNNDVAESLLLDTTRACVVRQYRTRSTVHSTNAIAPTLDCLACYDSSSLSLYDFSGRNRTKDSKASGKGKKRSQDAMSSEDLDCDCLIGTIAPTIEDEVGIRARLNCLAFNKTGTSLIGGTDAGDLFLWRGG